MFRVTEIIWFSSHKSKYQNIQLRVKVPCSIPRAFNMQIDLLFRVFASHHKFYFRVLPPITGFSSSFLPLITSFSL